MSAAVLQASCHRSLTLVRRPSDRHPYSPTRNLDPQVSLLLWPNVSSPLPRPLFANSAISSSSSSYPMTPMETLADASMMGGYTDNFKIESAPYPQWESDAERFQASSFNRMQIREAKAPALTAKCRRTTDDDEEMTRVLVESVTLGTAGDNGFPPRVWQLVVNAVNTSPSRRALKSICSCQSRYQYVSPQCIVIDVGLILLFNPIVSPVEEQDVRCHHLSSQTFRSRLGRRYKYGYTSR
jgi:hypothetical protein